MLALCTMAGARSPDRQLMFDCLPRDHQAAVWCRGAWQPLSPDGRYFRLPEACRSAGPNRFRLSRPGYLDSEIEVSAAVLNGKEPVRIPQRIDQVLSLEPRLVQVTFRTRPEGAQVFLQLPGGHEEFIGLSGRPLALNLSKVIGGSSAGLFYVEFRKSGYHPASLPIPSHTFQSDASDWPDDGALPLAPVGVSAWLVLAGAGATAAALRWGLRRRQALSREAAGPRLGPYLLLQRVAAGGSGVVFQARLADAQAGDLRAIKVLHPHLADQPGGSEQFAREAALLATLRHPNVVQVYDWGEDLGRPYLVMDWVQGQDLRHALTAHALGHKSACALLRQAALALAHAHERGVVHRDVKPENLLVSSDGKLRLIDFGLALATEPAGAKSTDLSGTAGYMAPERLAGGPATTFTDQYALGVVAFEALANRLPLSGQPGLAQARPGLPPELVALVERMLHPDPAERFATLGEVADALAYVLSRS